MSLRTKFPDFVERTTIVHGLTLLEKWGTQMERWNIGKVEYCVLKSEGIDLFLTRQLIIPVSHFSTIPVGVWLSEVLYDQQNEKSGNSRPRFIDTVTFWPYNSIEQEKSMDRALS